MPKQSAVNLVVSDLRRASKKSMGEVFVNIVELVGADEWREWAVSKTEGAPVPLDTKEGRVAFYLDNKAHYDQSIKDNTRIYGQTDLGWYMGGLYRKDCKLGYNTETVTDVFVNHNTENPMFRTLASQFVLNNIESLSKGFTQYLAHP